MKVIIKESKYKLWVENYLDNLNLKELKSSEKIIYQDSEGKTCFIYQPKFRTKMNGGWEEKYILFCSEYLENTVRSFFNPNNLARIIVPWFESKYGVSVEEFFYRDLSYFDY